MCIIIYQSTENMFISLFVRIQNINKRKYIKTIEYPSADAPAKLGAVKLYLINYMWIIIWAFNLKSSWTFHNEIGII